MTIPEVRGAEGKKLRETKPLPTADAREKLIKALGGFPDVKPVNMWTEGFEDLSLYHFQPEPGVKAMVYYRFDANIPRRKNAPSCSFSERTASSRSASSGNWPS